jgi:hypothetical protein
VGLPLTTKVPLKGREGEERQQQRVEAGHDRHPGDACVAEGLRDVHCREDDAGQRVAHGTSSLHRFYSLEQTQQIETPAWLRKRNAFA